MLLDRVAWSAAVLCMLFMINGKSELPSASSSWCIVSALCTGALYHRYVPVHCLSVMYRCIVSPLCTGALSHRYVPVRVINLLVVLGLLIGTSGAWVAHWHSWCLVCSLALVVLGLLIGTRGAWAAHWHSWCLGCSLALVVPLRCRNSEYRMIFLPL